MFDPPPPTPMPTPTRSQLRRAVCVALVLAQLTACTTWRPVSRTPDPQYGPTHIAHARVWLRNGSHLPLREVTVGADSVIGYGEDSHERQARPAADVASIDRLQVSAGRSALVVISAAAAITALAAASLASTASNVFSR